MGLFDFLSKDKSIEIKPKIHFGTEGANITFDSSRCHLPLNNLDKLYIADHAPKLSKSLRTLTSLIEQTDTNKEQKVYFDNGGVFISYAAIEALRFGDKEQLFGIDDKDLEVLGVPNYTPLKMELRTKSNLNKSDFRLVLDSFFKTETLDLSCFHGHTFEFRNKTYLLPFLQGKLIDSLKHHQLDIKTKKHQSDREYRTKVFAKIRQQAIEANIYLEKYIEKSEYIHLDQLPYKVGRDLYGQVIITPSVPEYLDDIEFPFQDQIDNLDTQHEVPVIRVTGTDGKKQRILFSDQAKSDLEKIRDVNSKSQEEKEEILNDLEGYFGYGPKSSIEFSDRVTGIIIGKGDSNRDNSNSKIFWDEGFEGNTVFLKDSKGRNLELAIDPMPEIYEEIKKELKSHHNISNDDSKESYVSLNCLENEYKLSEIEEYCRRIEKVNVVPLDEENIEKAQKIIEAAEKKGDNVVSWYDDEKECETKIPLASLKLSLPTRKKEKSSRDSVTLEANPVDEMLFGESPKTFDWSQYKYDNSKPDLPCFRNDIELRNHQAIGFNWLTALKKHGVNGNSAPPFGALIADDMGVGKTIQAIAFASSFFEELKQGASGIIIAPIALLKTSWLEDGFIKFMKNEADDLNLYSYQGVTVSNYREAPPVDKKLMTIEAKRLKENFDEKLLDTQLYEQIEAVREWAKSRIIMTSYATLRNNSFVLGLLNFRFAILDEAQNIKNSSALQSHAAKSLNADHKIAMTGTPIENTIMDLWSIVDFAAPGHLGSRYDFKKEFFNHLKTAEPGSKQREHLVSRLESKLKPIWLRRTKKEVLSDGDALPEITFYDDHKYDGKYYRAEMSSIQKELYEHCVSHFKHAKRGEKLISIRKMLDICIAPWLKEGIIESWKEKDQLFKVCPKLEIFFNILNEIAQKSENEGNKVIIFVNLIDVQKSLQYLIEDWYRTEYKKEIKINTYNGSVPEANRQMILTEFKESSGFNALIISPKSGGVGLNLTQANHVIHYTREWNPAIEKQATDRVYRIGQTRPVHVFFPTSSLAKSDLLCAEEHLANILSSKREVLEDFTLSSENIVVNPADFEKCNGEKADVVVKAEDIVQLDPYEFEGLVALILKNEGFTVEICGGSFDRGADIIATSDSDRMLIQAKHTKKGKNIGSKAINEVRSAKSVYEQNRKQTFRLVAVTNTGFIEDAIIHAKQGDEVTLWDKRFFHKKLQNMHVMRSDIAVAMEKFKTSSRSRKAA